MCVGDSTSQTLTHNGSENPNTAESESNEPASSKAENSGPIRIFLNDSPDDDNPENPPSTTKTTEPPKEVQFQLEGDGYGEDTGEAASYVHPASDMNGQLDFVGNKRPYEYNVDYTAMTRVGTRRNDIPDSEGSDDEDPGSTQTTNAHTDANTVPHTNAHINAHTASNIEPDADVSTPDTDPAPYNEARTAARSSRKVASAGKNSKKRKASNQEASSATRTGGREDASATSKNLKKRKASNSVNSRNYGVHDIQAEHEGLPGNQKYSFESAFYGHPTLAKAIPRGADALKTATSDSFRGEAAVISPLRRASRERSLHVDAGLLMTGATLPESRYRIGTDERSDATQEVHTPAPTNAECTTSTRSSRFLLCGAEILSIIPRDECIEIGVDGCWWLQFVDKPSSSRTYRGSYTIRVSSIELAGPADKGVFWLCKELQDVTPRVTNEVFP
ncbi:hypothetical protein ISF_09362 [Cordyceps fumosorosea ARSEF 2679]|uniref:Uncharacterized protein n=1 Tax=Cordyceps fumosorosea (strain ARSEF 2679) TaxID=1081104 RepID=A0A167JGK8_CORFA|nr:hypothetical protein ISF_09362 [Cordyceps fumosorosea ARSEF 2679]OAA50232.1 hypothetical protein ISF_09362 [Cordyceps fumosorosea ARSEF 2679]